VEILPTTKVVGFLSAEGHDCKDCGARPEIKEYDLKFCIICPNERCRIRQGTPECDELEVAAKIWNRNHKRGANE